MPETPDDAPPTWTIDELAAHTGVPSRTIRFYQSKGALQKPEIQGRKAIYGVDHVERLKLIGELQDRGLRIRAIRDLVGRIDRGEVALQEWLGLEARLAEPWHEDEPVLLSQDELQARVGATRTGVVADLVRLGFAKREGRQYLVSSPKLLQVAVKLQEAGVELEVVVGGLEIMRRHLGRLSEELVALYARHAGTGFGGDGSAVELGEAFASVGRQGLDAVEVVWAQEMQRVLREMVKTGALTKMPKAR
ncbi:MAG: MerR family transcriptional regulator [Alphaproteobacteria bacterium]|nr:MerR family transcriptional regulator [Alphaproteobacteria bacterium]